MELGLSGVELPIRLRCKQRCLRDQAVLQRLQVRSVPLAEEHSSGCSRPTFMKLREPLRFTGKMQSATVSREADRWFIAMAVEIPQSEVHPPSGEAVGIDLGLTTFAVLSNGEKVEAPKPLGKGLQRLRRLARAHSRKRRGSHNRRKAALRLARGHRRIANMRGDFLHKFTTRISKNHAGVFVENLHVKGMVQNRYLSRAIHDV